MKQNAYRPRRDSLALLSGITFGSLLGILSANIAPFQIGALIDQLHFAPRQVGALVTSELLTVSIVALFSAPVFTRLSCATFAIGGLAISLVGQVATVFGDSYTGLLVARLIAGGGLGMIYAAANAAGASSRDPHRLFSLCTAAALVILALLLPIFSVMNSKHGFRGIYVIVIILSIMMLPGLKGLGLGRQQHVDVLKIVPGPPARVAQLLIALACFNVGAGAVWSSFERIGVGHGMSAEAIGWLAGLCAWAGIGGALTVAWVAPRFNQTAPLAIGLSLAATACYVVPAAPTSALFVAGSIIYWVSYMFIYPCLLAIAASFDRTGRCSAAAAGTLMTSYSFGPLAASILHSGASHKTLASFGVASCALAMLALLPLTLALDRETQS